MARAGGRWKYVDKRSSCVVILSAAGEGCDFEYAAATVTESAPKTRALLDTRLKNGRKPDIPSLSLRSVAGARDRPILFLAEAAHPAAQLAGVLTLRKPLSPDRLQAALGGLLRPPSRPGGDAS